MSKENVPQENSESTDCADEMGVIMRESAEDKLIQALLCCSEINPDEENVLEIVGIHEVEAIKPWQSVAPVPKFSQGIIQKKRKAFRELEDQYTDPEEKQTSVSLYRRSVGPSNDREGTWRICVEPTTYRYLPNNGTYRTSKIEQRMHRNRPVRKPVEKLSPEQRQLQREIQRELRKELENSSQISTENNSVRESVDTVQLLNTLDSANADSSKNSTQSSPQPNAVVSSKSVSDRIFENFANRISSLDEEMKNDIRLYKKWEEGIIQVKTVRSRSEPGSSRTRDTTGPAVVRSDTVSQVKPVISYQELVKNKPVLHHADSTSKLTVTSSKLKNKVVYSQKSFTEFKYNPRYGLDDVKIVPMSSDREVKKNYPFVEKQHRSHKSTHVEGQQDNETLETLLTTTKYGPNKTTKKSNISPDPEIRSYGEHSHKADTSSFSSVSVPQDADNSLPTSLLPEIAGKRLEIPVSVNR